MLIKAFVTLLLSFISIGKANKNMARLVGGRNADWDKWSFIVAIYLP